MPDTRPAWEIREEREILQQRKEMNEKIFSFDASKTFENFNVQFNGQSTDVIEIKKFMGTPSCRRLILKGDVGRGKTHLAQACNNLVNNKWGRGSVIISARRLYWLFRELEGFECEYIYEKAMKRIWAARFLIIDDLGTEKQTDTQVFNQNFMELLDEFEGKIIITTNLSERDMENIYGQKIVSRIYEDAVVVVLRGKDHRRQS